MDGTAQTRDVGTLELGEFGERLAERHLIEAGMRILHRNWRCRDGELDLIALDGACLVVCEVKTRRSERAGTALDGVHPRKVARLRRLAAIWLAEQQEHYPEVRIDVVGVSVLRHGAARLDHIRGVI